MADEEGYITKQVHIDAESIVPITGGGVSVTDLDGQRVVVQIPSPAFGPDLTEEPLALGYTSLKALMGTVVGLLNAAKVAYGDAAVIACQDRLGAAFKDFEAKDGGIEVTPVDRCTCDHNDSEPNYVNEDAAREAASKANGMAPSGVGTEKTFIMMTARTMAFPIDGDTVLPGFILEGMTVMGEPKEMALLFIREAIADFAQRVKDLPKEMTKRGFKVARAEDVAE